MAREAFDCELVCLADRSLLAQRAQQLALRVALFDYDPAPVAAHVPGELSVLHLPLAVPSIPGQLDKANARYVLAMLDRAIDGAHLGRVRRDRDRAGAQGRDQRRGRARSTATPNISPQRTGTPLPVMMLAAAKLRVALATTHLPLQGCERGDHHRAVARCHHASSIAI